MIMTRRRSTACKMALAGMFTALVLESTIQNGLFVPAHAEDSEQKSDAEVILDELENTIKIKAASSAGLALFKSSPQAAAAVWGAQTMTKIALENAIQSGNDQDFVYEMGNYSFASGTYVVSGLEDDTHYAMAPLFSGSFSMSNGSYITLCESDTFNLRYTLYDYGNYTDTNFVVTYSGNVPGSFSVTSSNSWGRVTLHNAGTRLSGNYFAAEMSGNFYGTESCQIIVNRSSVPTFDYNTCKDSFLGYIYSKAACNGSISYPLFGVGVTVSMPEGEFSAANVSGYYNDVLLPWIFENYPDTMDLVAFPNGIGEDPDLPDVGTLDSLTFPPGLPSASFNDVELPSEPLPAKMLSGATFWFTQFTNMLDALGVKYIVITFLIIALILAILKI